MKLARALNIGDHTVDTHGASLDKIVSSLLHISANNLYEAGRNAARTAVKDALITAALAALPDGATENAKRHARDAIAEPNYLVVMVQLGMKKLIENNVPFHVLAQVERFLRCLCRKPSEMKFREFMNHFMRINLEEAPIWPLSFEAVTLFHRRQYTD